MEQLNKPIGRAQGLVSTIADDAATSASIDAAIYSAYDVAFHPVPHELILKAAAHLFGIKPDQFSSLVDTSGSDIHRVFIRMARRLGQWVDSLLLGATDDGGQQRQLNSRVHELVTGRVYVKDATARPCLWDVGLDVACFLEPGPTGRDNAFFRIVFRDEIPHSLDSGRKLPFRKRVARTKPNPARSRRLQLPAQEIEPRGQSQLFKERPQPYRWSDPESDR